MKVPKLIDEFLPLFKHPDGGIVTGEKWRLDKTDSRVDGRFVPDDLLKERFAFSGHCVIEVETLRHFVICLTNLASKDDDKTQTILVNMRKKIKESENG